MKRYKITPSPSLLSVTSVYQKLNILAVPFLLLPPYLNDIVLSKHVSRLWQNQCPIFLMTKKAQLSSTGQRLACFSQNKTSPKSKVTDEHLPQPHVLVLQAAQTVSSYYWIHLQLHTSTPVQKKKQFFSIISRADYIAATSLECY